MSDSMEGRVALVTGAGSGIGRAIALAFAKDGVRVAAADVSESRGKETVELVEHVGSKAVFIKCDVKNAGEIQNMVATTVKDFGRLDFACNNAGIHQLGRPPLAEVEETTWDEIIDVNLKGVFLCMKYEIMHMLKQGSGVIVNTSSVSGVVGEKGSSAYTASKHGVMGLTKAAAVEYAENGIRVNAVCPGATVTPMSDRAQGEVRQWIMNRYPVGRFGRAEEVAAAVMWLCSDLAAFVTGTGVLVDGAMTAQ